MFRRRHVAAPSEVNKETSLMLDIGQFQKDLPVGLEYQVESQGIAVCVEGVRVVSE